MKKPLLLVFVLLMNLGFLLAQKSVLVKDSIYITGRPTTTPALEDILSFQYDSVCRKSVYESQLVDPVTGEVRNSQQAFYSYYPDNNLYQFILQNSAGGPYKDYSRSTYTYTSKNQDSTSLLEIWTDSSYWRTASFSTTAYDAAGNITDQISQVRNADIDSLVNYSESKFEFNSQNQDTAAITLLWNLNTQTWVPYEKVVSFYDSKGFLVKSNYQNWEFSTPGWQLETETKYYNNSKGDADSSLQISYPDTNIIDKTYFVYDSATSLLTKSTHYSYYGNDLYYAYRYLYSHIATSEYQKDTTISEILNLSADTFAVSEQYAYTIVFGKDSSYQKTIESADWNDENLPYVYEDRYTYTPCQSVLPVTLLNFTGSQKNKDAVLHWQTSNEINTSYFTVQRSTDGIHFINIGKVMASGNSSTLKDYSYTDANITLLNTNKLFYRLAEQDNNGKNTFSNTVELFISGGKLSVTISPNPVQNTIVIYSPVAISNAVIKVADMNGRVLYSTQKNIVAGDKVMVDASQLAKGIYIVTIQSQSDKQLFKIVK